MVNKKDIKKENKRNRQVLQIHLKVHEKMLSTLERVNNTIEFRKWNLQDYASYLLDNALNQVNAELDAKEQEQKAEAGSKK